jgi:hypothetical protein
MDVVALVGAGHVVCMIQLDDVGESFTFKLLCMQFCFGFCVSPNYLHNQPTSAYICMFTAPKAEEPVGNDAMFMT